MRQIRLGRSLAVALAVVAAFFFLSSASMPVRDRRLPGWVVVAVPVLMLAQAVLYWFGERVRDRIGVRGYVGVQAAIVFGVGMTKALLPAGLAMYVALTAETVVLAGAGWGTVQITFGAVVLFGINAILTHNLYFGATAALVLALTALIAHAIAAIVMRPAPVPAALPAPPLAPAPAPPPAHTNGAIPSDWDLTPREEEVLRALATGSRSSDIGVRLGITERTVKAHLASIYQKLGVESRSAAVAALLRRDGARVR
ncbi:MAG TPA: LuxR C-terminal-related transcriptional regulator [Gemmatimonadaceae bacterium]|nr:LuxR C-terminal-related transcriptional regulator [Gemmatimonadaceae bacterium]